MKIVEQKLKIYFNFGLNKQLKLISVSFICGTQDDFYL